MANKGRTSFAKRQKEIARQERAREKNTKRVERKDEKGKIVKGPGEEDPDIAGIVPGPQPLPYDILEGDAAAAAAAAATTATTEEEPKP